MTKNVKIITVRELKELTTINIEKEALVEIEDDMPVAFFDGDLEVNGNFDLDDFVVDAFQKDKERFSYKGHSYQAIQVIWITGKLNISQTLIDTECENYSHCLFVEKEVIINNIVFGGWNLHFLSDVNIKGIFYTKLGAEGSYKIKGNENIYIEVDNNSHWVVKNQEDIDIDTSEEMTSLSDLKKIFINPLDYVAEEEGVYFFEDDEEEKFLQDLIDNKEIFIFK